MKRLFLPLVLFAMMLCTSCVSMSTYETLRSDYAELKTENQDLSKQVADMQAIIDDLATPAPTATPELVAVEALRDITITLFEPNSADGVDVALSWYNNSELTIKYITFSITPYNAVGDQVWCEIRNKSTMNLTVTGPNEPWDTAYCTFETVWYNPTTDSCVLQEIRIEYTDGTILEIPKSAVDAIGVTYKQGKSKY